MLMFDKQTNRHRGKQKINYLFYSCKESHAKIFDVYDDVITSAAAFIPKWEYNHSLLELTKPIHKYVFSCYFGS